jgi:hypothetical protein
MGIRGVRLAAGIGLVLAALGVCYAVAAMAGWDPAWGAWFRVVLHLGELAVVVALAGLGVVGALGRVGCAAAVLGQLLLTAAEIVFPIAPDLGDTLFGLATLLSGAGMVCLGIALRRGSVLRWSVLPLLVGVWILVPVTPVLIVTGGPPDLLALAVLGAWDALWVATAATVLISTARLTVVAARGRAPA